MTVARYSANIVLLICLGGILPAAGQTRQNRIAISTQSVVSAMAQAGWRVGPERVKFLSQVTSTAAEPGLQVAQVTHWQGDKLRVELRCHDPHACLPFYVLVTEQKTTGKPGQTPAAVANGGPAALEMAEEKPLIRSGDPATLTFADRGLRITMPVICLENGRRGQEIRVASSDHRRFYKAEIVGPGLLKATTL
ncbi:MAG: flagella basal body P-ring formation protein FlgA [Terriglobales bacterium]